MHESLRSPSSSTDTAIVSVSSREATCLSELSPQQVKSGLAAWLGWLFDGLDMHLYVLVATPFVAELLGVTNQKDPQVGYYSSLIQAAFLIGWALGGSFFGRVADRVGRSRALMLTILTYAAFTGLSFFAQTWWHLLIFRFLAALGIGGEWAVDAATSRTDYPKRTVFLVGILPALLVLWIRQAVPEPEEWHAAKQQSLDSPPKFLDLFRGDVRRTTVLTLIVCTLSLTGHWAFLFWHLQHVRNLPEISQWADAEKSQLISQMVWVVMLMSIVGNFLAGFMAQWLKYRTAIALLFLGYFVSMTATYSTPRDHHALWYCFVAIGLCHGCFALFTMYLPPLFPTLLRTTGAGFCYNFGRIVAGVGTVFFGLFSKVGDSRLALFYAGFLFLPAACFAILLPEPPAEPSIIPPRTVE